MMPASGSGYESLIWLGGGFHDDGEGVAIWGLLCKEERVFARSGGEARLSIALWKLRSWDSGQKASSTVGVT